MRLRVLARTPSRLLPKSLIFPENLKNWTPMAVDKETVRKVARLARLAVADERLEPMTRELNGILKWVEQLQEIDTKDVPPMTSVVTMKLKMRDDVVTDGGYAADLMKNAPDGEDDFFTVPKVVE